MKAGKTGKLEGCVEWQWLEQKFSKNSCPCVQKNERYIGKTLYTCDGERTGCDVNRKLNKRGNDDRSRKWGLEQTSQDV